MRDDEVDREAHRESSLRYALQNEEWALCAALKQQDFRAEVWPIPHFVSICCRTHAAMPHDCSVYSDPCELFRRLQQLQGWNSGSGMTPSGSSRRPRTC